MTTPIQFQRATKAQAKIRMAVIGPSGAGKTFTSLSIAQHLGARVALIDTEHGSASKYADRFTFDALNLQTFHPQLYIDAIKAAGDAGYDVLIIDSLSHAWAGKDGALELVDRAAAGSKGNNNFAAWRGVTPLQHQLVDAILAAPCHVLATMRAKMEYVMESGAGGKPTVRKVGLQPVQRDQMEYEFDVVGDVDMDNNLTVGKTRCPALTGRAFPKAGKELAKILLDWVTDGRPVDPTSPQPTPEETAKLDELRNKLTSLRGRTRLAGGTVFNIKAAGEVATLEEIEGWIKDQAAELEKAETAEAERVAAAAAATATDDNEDPSARRAS